MDKISKKDKPIDEIMAEMLKEAAKYHIVDQQR